MSSMYGSLCPLAESMNPGICVWNKRVPLKISFFMWELWWDRVPTIDKLRTRGLIIPNRCCLCGVATESSEHLFLHCPWVEPLWVFFLSRFEVLWSQPKSIRCLLECWPSQCIKGGSDKGRLLWQLIPTALYWSIWEERNGRTFNDKVSMRCIILDAILSKTSNWLFDVPSMDQPSFRSWIFEWDSLILYSVLCLCFFVFGGLHALCGLVPTSVVVVHLF